MMYQIHGASKFTLIAQYWFFLGHGLVCEMTLTVELGGKVQLSFFKFCN